MRNGGREREGDGREEEEEAVEVLTCSTMMSFLVRFNPDTFT